MRLASFQLLLLLFASLCVSTAVRAGDTVTSLVLEVLPDATEIDESAVDAGLRRELGVAIVRPDAPIAARAGGTLLLGIDRARAELFVEFRRPGAEPLTRRVPLPADREAIARTVVFLAGNMVRNESQQLLRELAKPEPPPAPPPMSAPPLPPEPPAPPPTPPPPERHRWWIGAELEAAAAIVGTTNEVCRGGTPYTCIDGADHAYTAGASVPVGRAGAIVSGVVLFSPHEVISIDYAVTDNLMIGGTIGWGQPVAPSSAGGRLGGYRSDVRARYVLGERPLLTEGAHLTFSFAVGVAEWAAPVSVVVADTANATGATRYTAWRVTTGQAVSVGGGIRWTLSPTVAITLEPIRLSLDAGPWNPPTLLLFTPTAGAQVAF